MSDLKFCIIANAVIDCVYAACVTVAAMHFEKPSVLWWYVLLLGMGMNFKSRGNDNAE